MVKAGRGGDGIASFKSAKGKPKLGPDGGDGGTGGDVVLQADPGQNTLSNLRFRAEYRSEDGVRGGPNGCRGRCGEDLLIPVPIGTVIRNEDTGEVVGELLEKGQSLIVAKGGRHGLGNTHWATATHQAPEEFRPGGPGEIWNLALDLKLIADVGLAGFPNAGKSTLLSKMSAAKPKIADYPFTTLTPQLGVVDVEVSPFHRDSFVIADIPGLIEGASDGKGLGLQFLKHLERTSVVAYVLDIDDLQKTPAESYLILREELKKYSPEMAKKHAIIILNKIDCCDDDYVASVEQDLILERPLEVIPISAITGRGLAHLARRLNQAVKAVKAQVAEAAESALALETPSTTDFAPLNLPWNVSVPMATRELVGP